MSACPRPPRLRAFVRMVCSTKDKGQHGGANKCAQDAYLRPIAAYPCLLSCSLELPPMISSTFCASGPRAWTQRDKGSTAKTRVGHDYSASDANQSVVRLVRLERSTGGLENGTPKELLLIPFEGD